MKVRVFDIQWDTDGDKEVLATLPTELVIDVRENEDFDIEEEIGNIISDETGFCHFGFDYEFLRKEPDWFYAISEKLRDYSDGDVWAVADEILCRTEDIMEGICDLLFQLYASQGETVTFDTGFYDPTETEKCGLEDRRTGWYYINID